MGDTEGMLGTTSVSGNKAWHAGHATDQLASALALAATAGATVISFVLERGNRPYTDNYVTPADIGFGLAMFCVAVLGAVLLCLRPRHRTGWIMLTSVLLLNLGLLCHAAAIRWMLVDPTRGFAPDVSAWLAIWLIPLGLAALPFALATWPTGRIETGWQRKMCPAAVLGLAIATVAQAFTPDHLDGVAQARIDNPYAIQAFTSVSSPLTAAGLGLVATFGLASAGRLLWVSFVRAKNRVDVYPVATVMVVLVFAIATIASNPVFALALVAPVVALALVIAAAGTRRLERVERSRAELISEREAERHRLRRDLHDGIGPILAALRLELDSHAAIVSERALTLTDNALTEIRRISRALRPAALDELGLVGAIRELVDTIEASGGPRASLQASPLPVLPPAIEVAALRIAAEALTNVVRHANAAHVAVHLERNDNALVVRIVDNGTGWITAAEGAGLPSMRTRATELGGTCQILSGPNGTTVHAALPIDLR